VQVVDRTFFSAYGRQAHRWLRGWMSGLDAAAGSHMEKPFMLWWGGSGRSCVPCRPGPWGCDPNRHPQDDACPEQVPPLRSLLKRATRPCQWPPAQMPTNCSVRCDGPSPRW